MSGVRAFILILLSAVLAISCENTEAELLSFEVLLEGSEAIIDKESMSIMVAFPENAASAEDLCADFRLSDGAAAYVGNILQKRCVSKNNYEVPFSLTICSEDGTLSRIWQVNSTNNDYTVDWGLGGFIQDEVSHNRSYDWYIDQSQTGEWSDWNCAPSCVVMASHWREEDFPHFVEDARNLYHPTGGGWFTEDIDNCLSDFGIDHSIIQLSEYRVETAQILMDHLNNGCIIILAIDVYYMDMTLDPDIRVGKYYNSIKHGTGHCILIKGYKQVDGQVYFETYDPVGYDYIYSDGSFMGKDRYYHADDIYTTIFASWNYAFVIPGPGSKKSIPGTVKASEIPVIRIL
jgi:hypothetical protein